MADDAILVARSWGGPHGELQPKGHAGLVVDAGTPDRVEHWLIQAGPTRDGRLVGSAIEVGPAGWQDTFSQARGANWSRPTDIVRIPLIILGTFSMAACLTAAELVRAATELDARLANARYDAEGGPNSNSYVRLFMQAIGLPSDFVPAGMFLPGWGIEPPLA